MQWWTKEQKLCSVHLKSSLLKTSHVCGEPVIDRHPSLLWHPILESVIIKRLTHFHTPPYRTMKKNLISFLSTDRLRLIYVFVCKCFCRRPYLWPHCPRKNGFLESFVQIFSLYMHFRMLVIQFLFVVFVYMTDKLYNIRYPYLCV